MSVLNGVVGTRDGVSLLAAAWDAESVGICIFVLFFYFSPKDSRNLSLYSDFFHTEKIKLLNRNNWEIKSIRVSTMGTICGCIYIGAL